MAVTINGSSGVTTNDGSVFTDASGNVGIGTSSPAQKLEVNGLLRISAGSHSEISNNSSAGREILQLRGKTALADGAGINLYGAGDSLEPNSILFFTDGSSSRGRFTSSGDLLVGKASSNTSTDGFEALAPGTSTTGAILTNSGASGTFIINRQTSDGILISFRQANTQEGNISVSGTTVSYNGGHLSRWAQTTTPKDESLVKGTVLSNLDEMNVYTDAEGNPVENEQLNKVKVSDVEGDSNVAGVFVNWEHDEAHNVDEINMAMTGDMIIRIAQGVTVQRGDLLMSAGDGTAKPQGDDIVRSKTIAKVTSTHVTCTYADGSFCVPCVLMAC